MGFSKGGEKPNIQTNLEVGEFTSQDGRWGPYVYARDPGSTYTILLCSKLIYTGLLSTYPLKGCLLREESVMVARGKGWDQLIFDFSPLAFVSAGASLIRPSFQYSQGMSWYLLGSRGWEHTNKIKQSKTLFLLPMSPNDHSGLPPVGSDHTWGVLKPDYIERR